MRRTRTIFESKGDVVERLRVRVRAWSAAGIVLAALILGSTGATAAQAAAPPGQVTALKVVSQDWTNRTVKVQWARVAGATSYAAKWSTDSHFSKPVWGSTTGTTLSVGKLSPATTYYLVVAAKNTSGSGRYSATLQLKLKPQSVGTFTSVSATPTPTGLRVSFSAVPNASDYRVRWSAGPNENRVPDRWQEHYSPWLTAFGKTGTLTFDVPMSASDLTSTPYGNPIYARLQARNTYFDKTYVRKSPQVSAWPTPTRPAPTGTQLRVASYNVMCSGCEPAGGKPWTTRVTALSSVIEAAAPDVLTALEASGPSGSTANKEAYQDLDAHLGTLRLTNENAAPTGTTEAGTRIFYNPAKLTLRKQGYLLGVKDYRTYPASTAKTTSIPWAAFSPKDQPNRRFLVVAAHFALPSASYGAGAKKGLLGNNSAQLLVALDELVAGNSEMKGIPVVLGGDLNDHRYPENESDGAQPTLVRAGFYDSSASLHRSGTDKPTYNGFRGPADQSSDPNRDGLRIDYLLTKGISGSLDFTNVWNPGTPVQASDHNLIATTVRLPW